MGSTQALPLTEPPQDPVLEAIPPQSVWAKLSQSQQRQFQQAIARVCQELVRSAPLSAKEGSDD
jgi:hypothetical protein